MSGFIRHFTGAIAHTASHERRAGRGKNANGLTLISCGIIFLPIPIIGLPLLIWGLITLFKK